MAQENSNSVDVCIYYGTQTGTAEKYSKYLSKALSEKNVTCLVQNIVDFDPDETFLSTVVSRLLYSFVVQILNNI